MHEVNVLYVIIALLIGIGSGVLSGVFGIGGGLIMTPLILVFMPLSGVSIVGIQAVETPILAILPTTLSGTWAHIRAKNVDVRTALISGFAGAVTAYFGAVLAKHVGGTTLLLITGIILVGSAIDMFRRAFNKKEMEEEEMEDIGAAPEVQPNLALLIIAGLLAGLGSGLLGVGGGFLLVPLYVGLFGMSMKRAAGTSLLAISIISIPSLITHIVLGNIDVALGILLGIGAIPGVLLGARIGLGSKEKPLHIGFGALMIVAGLLLAATQLGWLG